MQVDFRAYPARAVGSGALVVMVLAAATLSARGTALNDMPVTAASAPAVVPVRVASAGADVDAATTLGIVPPAALGLNMGVWDSHFLDLQSAVMMRRADVTLLRFPGGSTADIYHWQANSITPGQVSYADPANTFDAFMKMARRIGAQPLLTVNYGSNATGSGGGDPAEAAAWVRYANRIRHYGVTYWEIGNEVYGPWEPNLWPDHSPAFYAREAAVFAAQMRAQDPAIKIGIPIWIDDVGFGRWNTIVLPRLCSAIDFVDVHFYPENPRRESDADLLASTAQIPAVMATLRSDLRRSCGSRAARIQVIAGELNSISRQPGKQTVGLPNALFLADSYMTWLERGAVSVDWWALHLGIQTQYNNDRRLFGTARYGDFGMLSNAGVAGSTREPPANTPFPPYFGLQMLARFTRPGDRMVAARSSRPALSVHAVARNDGSVGVLLIDKDRRAAYRVTITLTGHGSLRHAVALRYGIGSASIGSWPVKLEGSRVSVVVTPYSLTGISVY